MHHTDERLESRTDKCKLLLVTQEHEISLGNGFARCSQNDGFLWPATGVYQNYISGRGAVIYLRAIKFYFAG